MNVFSQCIAIQSNISRFRDVIIQLRRLNKSEQRKSVNRLLEIRSYHEREENVAMGEWLQNFPKMLILDFDIDRHVLELSCRALSFAAG